MDSTGGARPKNTTPQPKQEEKQDEGEIEESGSEEETESEEEDEPKLKYERILGDLRDILKRDGASYIAVNSKLLIIGTNWGRIKVLDHQGNRIKEYALHSTAVTMIDMDSNGDYVASCSNDRKVAIQGLYTTENSHLLTMDKPIRSIALDPNYFKPRSGRRFVTGDDRVTLYEKGLFGHLKPTVLSEGSAVVRAMKWCGQFLAWATDSGVRVMDMDSQMVITLIKRDHSYAISSEQCPPNLCWKDERTLLVGWGDSIKVCAVRDGTVAPTQTPSGPHLPPYFVQILYMFTTDFFICGIGPLDDLIVVLSYNKETDRTNPSLGVESRRPQIRILEPLQKTYEEISKDVLAIRCYQEYRTVNYHLASLVEEKQFYIVCPQDVVLGKPRTDDDRVQWLLERNRFEEAMKLVESCRDIKRYTVLGVGQLYLDHLMAEKDYQGAAKLCKQIFGGNKGLWEDAVVRFGRVRQLRVLSPYLPKGGRDGLTLDPAVYQTVLLELLQLDHQGFLQVIQDWPGNLYNVSAIINAVLETLARNTNNTVLLQALAHLYSNIEKHDKALAIYLKLRHKDVFHLIAKHTLYSVVAKHVVDLMSLDSQSTLDICCQHPNLINPDHVVAALANHTQFLYMYLDALYKRRKDLSLKYHSQLVILYADLARPQLLPLLQTSSSYDLSLALDTCRARCLTSETIHLLDRMGNSSEALRLILEEQRNMMWAIDLCKDHDDHDLWNQLIKHSLDKPEYIRILLNNIGTHIDPLLIVQRIPCGLEIPGLRDALVKILHDYHLQISLRSGCQRILASDCSNLTKKLVSTQNAGLPVHNDTVCPACNKKILPSNLEDCGSFAVFSCRHVYHNICLPEDSGKEVCLVCRKDKKKGIFMT